MNLGPQERDLLRRYLLGELSEEARDEVGTRLFADEPFAEAMEDAERDLLDAYARGELNAGDRAAVELRLLVSEGQQEKLRFARALARRSKRSLLLRYAAWAAAVILTISGAAGVWLHRSAKPQEVVSAPVATPATQPAPVFAALLSPGGLRDGEMPEVVLPPNAASVRLDLLLEDVKGSYSVQLVRQRDVVLEQGGLEAHVDGSTPVLSVSVPSSMLTAGQYRLSASPVGGRGALTYNFRVR